MWSTACLVDKAGMVPSRIPEHAGAVLLTPSHHYPTGTIMPAQRRRAIVDACRETGRWLVEDDFDSHMAQPGVVPAAIQALAPDGVILIGSLQAGGARTAAGLDRRPTRRHRTTA
jgi:GntR family transcriptional regulator/MocR family aminotransferase